MTKNLESLSAFESKSINQLAMKNVVGGINAPNDTGTLAGTRQIQSGTGYWSISYTSDTISSSGGATTYVDIESSAVYHSC
jgi:hypothetical protein